MIQIFHNAYRHIQSCTIVQDNFYLIEVEC